MRAPFIWTMITCMTVMPTAVQAADMAGKTKSEPVTLQNVELNQAGVVTGRLLDEKGEPLAGEAVEVQTQAGVQKLTTGKDGSFRIVSENSGSCAIHTKNRDYACRLWQHRTAPPKALTAFNIVHTDGPIIRAQDCGEGCVDGYGGRCGTLGGVSKGQLLGLGLLAGAVVAIVLAVENDDDDASN